MAKFIEVTDRGDKTKFLISIDKIVFVAEAKNGLADITIHVNDKSDTTFTIPCAETYVELFNTFCEFEMI